MDFLEIKNLTFSYGKKEVLKDLDLIIYSNKINALLGSNESGKTTLLKELNRKLPDSYICHFKENFKNNKNTVKNEIMLKSNNKILDEESIDMFNILIDLFEINNILDVKISDISILDKVKIIIISSIMSKKRIILLDDIFNLISYDDYVSIMKMTSKVLKKYKITLFYTTYKLDLCSKSDVISFLNEGKIVFTGDFNKIIEHDTKLSRCGIEISTMLDLCLKLKFYNLLDKIIMSPDRLVDELWK